MKGVCAGLVYLDSMHVSVIKCDVWVCLYLIVWQASQLGETCVCVCVERQARRLTLKDCFIVLLSFILGRTQSEGWMEGKKRRQGLRRGGVG